MNVSDAIASRFSARAFLDRPVERAVVESILERAARTPSGGNLQPWHVHVLLGERLEMFKSIIAERLTDHPMGEESEYNVYPPRLHEPYRSRRFKCGEDLYAAIDVPREDKPARLRQFANNFRLLRRAGGDVLRDRSPHGGWAVVRSRHVDHEHHAARP